MATWPEMTRMTLSIMNIRYKDLILNEALEGTVKASIADDIVFAIGKAVGINIQSHPSYVTTAFEEMSFEGCVVVALFSTNNINPVTSGILSPQKVAYYGLNTEADYRWTMEADTGCSDALTELVAVRLVINKML